MRIVVIGAGVVGLTTAWLLQERGHEITVVDSNALVGAGATARNGAQLSYAYVTPLAGPNLLAKIPALLLERDGPMRLRLSLEPAFWHWSMQFLLQCRASAERETIAAQLALAAVSRTETHRIASTLGLKFNHVRNGKLVVYRDKSAFRHAIEGLVFTRAAGVEQHVLSPKETLATEPAMMLAENTLAGGILTPDEEVGDAAAFSEGIGRAIAGRNGAAMMLNCTVNGFIRSRGRIEGVSTTHGDIRADLTVICAGSESRRLGREVNLRLPIYPLKGYSLTARLREGSLARSVTDFGRKTVFAPLGQGPGQFVRIAGIADFVGHDLQLDEGRLSVLRNNAASAFALDLEADDEPWAGLRPATPDSRPIICPSGIPGLFLNTGHGALGWTQACGSARLSADLIDGHSPTLSSRPFSIERF